LKEFPFASPERYSIVALRHERARPSYQLAMDLGEMMRGIL
jgi:hypothetical protein